MALKAFEVKGRFQMGRVWTPFTIQTADGSEENAREKVVSTLGSRHRVTRRRIEIAGVREIPVDEVTDPVVEEQLKVSA